MNPGVTTLRSILDKPLHELTEEDISQLTREDCRKYLKEKGSSFSSFSFPFFSLIDSFVFSGIPETQALQLLQVWVMR